MVKHHPNNDLLMSYGAGALGESWSLGIATHLALCPTCRVGVGEIEELGGVLLEDCEPTLMSDQSFGATITKLDVEAKVEDDIFKAPGYYLIPQPLRDYVDRDLESIPWKSIGGGVSHFTVVTGDEGKAHLLKIPPGKPVPEHGHNGREITLVLMGSFEDELGSYSRGDMQDVDEEIVHRPVAGGLEDCICFAVTDSPLEFRKLIPRLAQPFIRKFLDVSL